MITKSVRQEGKMLLIVCEKCSLFATVINTQGRIAVRIRGTLLELTSFPAAVLRTVSA